MAVAPRFWSTIGLAGEPLGAGWDKQKVCAGLDESAGQQAELAVVADQHANSTEHRFKYGQRVARNDAEDGPLVRCHDLLVLMTRAAVGRK